MLTLEYFRDRHKAHTLTAGRRAGARCVLFAAVEANGIFGPAPFVEEAVMGSLVGGGSSPRISSKRDFMLCSLKSLSADVCGSPCFFRTLFFLAGSGVFSILTGR